MAIEVKLNSLPESVEEATLMTWHKKEGDTIKREEKLVEVETDKVVLEIAAETDGVVTRLLKQPGDTLVAGDILAEIESGAVAAAVPGPAPDVEKPSSAETASVVEDQPVTADLSVFSPAARKLVIDHGLDPASVQGTGRGGRVTKADVMQQVESPAAPAETPAAVPASTEPVATPSAPPLPAPSGDRPEERVPMTRLRARIAERLLEAQHTAAILTTYNIVDMSKVVDLRSRYKETFEKEHGIKLGFMSFFVKATVEALKRFPAANGSIDGGDVVYHGYYDIGIAVSTERGLVVPVLRDADRLSFAEMESGIRSYGERARNGQITIEELTGGTFTITNGGVFGSMLSTPILNPPQSGILGMHAIQEMPIAKDGQVLIAPMMYIALSYDHRLIDGREAVSFLVAIKELIEDPSRLMLSV